MRRTLAVLATIATTALLAMPAHAETPGGDPVVWGVGDLCSENLRCAAVADLITDDPTVDGVALAGDLAYDTGSPSEFTRFHNLFGSKQLADGRTLRQASYPTPGNHEYRDTSSVCPHYFAYWGSTKAGTCNGQSWRQRVIGNWRVITLNSNYAEREPVCNAWCEAGVSSTKYPAGLTPTEAASQRAWLGSQCRNADANGMGGIVVWHHPAQSDGVSYSPGTELGRDLFAVAAANGCEIAITGHSHIYERFTPKNANGNYSATGLTEFLVGTGGAETAPQPTRDTAVVQWLGDGALRLVLTPTAARFEMRSVDGTLIDSGAVPIT